MNTLTMSNTLINAGFEKEQAEVVVNTIKNAVDEKHQETATKQDVKNLKELLYLVIAIGAATFGYLLNSINNNTDLLNTIISKLG